MSVLPSALAPASAHLPAVLLLGVRPLALPADVVTAGSDVTGSHADAMAHCTAALHGSLSAPSPSTSALSSVLFPRCPQEGERHVFIQLQAKGHNAVELLNQAGQSGAGQGRAGQGRAGH